MAKGDLGRLSINKPCLESWAEMSGNSEVRFCSHCSKNVHDLSSMTRSKAEQLVKDAGGSLCVRYTRDNFGNIVHQLPVPIVRARRSTAAASVLAASLSLSAAISPVLGADLQGTGPSIPAESSVGEKERRDSYSITGTVFDHNEAVIPGADVILTSSSNTGLRRTRTDRDGRFRFDELVPATYQLQIENPGFSKLVIKDIALTGDIDLKDNLILTTVGETLMGDIAIVEDGGFETIPNNPAPVSTVVESREPQDSPKDSTITMGIATPMPPSKKMPVLLRSPVPPTKPKKKP